MKKITFLFFFVCVFCICQDSKAQEVTPLYKKIFLMDSLLFDAFNNHRPDVLENMFAKNVEFYHDRDGLSDYATTINNFKRIFTETPDLHRELVKESLEVYGLPGFGALETGRHRFALTKNGQKISAEYKFTMIWQNKNGQWQITRAISVGH